jgi:outer membrane protein OmpA-like peptidoglycan-associated protein
MTGRFLAAMAMAAVLAAGCVPSRDPVKLPDSVPLERPLSADIRYVFFAPGKAVITPPGDAAIASAVVEDARRRAKGPPPRLTVTGHTDSSSNTAAAQRLSLQRAEAVARRLAAAGITPDRIAVSGAGTADPLLPAPPGAREPANDRVEIGF